VHPASKKGASARPIGAIFAIELGDRAAGNIVRLSAVDAEIESPWPPPVGRRIVVWAELISGEGEVAMRGRVDWSTQTRFGVALGPLGSRETYAILRAAHRFEADSMDSGTRRRRFEVRVQRVAPAGGKT
jgi:hypothetical protein